MRIGISQDAYLRQRDPAATARKLAMAGFDCIDFDAFSWCYKSSPLAKPNWEAWVAQIKRAADDAGIVYNQLHTPFWHFIDDPDSELIEEITKRSFTVGAMLGVKHFVMHPRFYKGGIREDQKEELLRYNIDWFRQWLPYAENAEAHIAIENLFHFSLPAQYMWTTPQEMCALIDGVGGGTCACLDTGHANIAGTKPAEFALALGDRLQVLHVHDNDGITDQHLLPWMGRIDWKSFFAALGSLHYQGVLSFETYNCCQRLPDSLIDQAVEFIALAAREMAEMVEESR